MAAGHSPDHDRPCACCSRTARLSCFGCADVLPISRRAVRIRRLVDQAAERVETLDLLMNNAGGTFAPSKKTHDVHEPNFQINHLAPFLLTNLKIDLDDLDGTGKLMNIVFTRGITQRWSDDGVASVAVHTGPVGSSFGRDSWFVGLIHRSPLKRRATISVPDGAAPLIALAERGPDPETNRRYFSRFNANGRENTQARDQSIIDGLWERSAALVGLT